LEADKQAKINQYTKFQLILTFGTMPGGSTPTGG